MNRYDDDHDDDDGYGFMIIHIIEDFKIKIRYALKLLFMLYGVLLT